uniref:Aryl hydrocarbon receptor nuclear translocator n=1 Tax=Macrostomum lignano TaxID=282301 RepID=A0A1I8GPX4_9PLAT
GGATGCAPGGRGGGGGGGGPRDQETLDKERYARESHCEIERRRRNKMSAYIGELCDMVPSCANLARKPDKLTILRMAVAHMRGLRGTGNTGVDGTYKPSFLSDLELKHLVLEAADGFLFVCQCDTGRLVYVSDSVSLVLGLSQAECYQRPLYDLLHPDDREKVRDQLASADPAAARVLDLKTGTVKKDGYHAHMRSTMGARRSFMCRMRICPPDAQHPQQPPHQRQRQRTMLAPSADGQQYVIAHPADGADSGEGPDPTVVTFCDQRVTAVLGHRPADLVGRPLSELAAPGDRARLRAAAVAAAASRGQAQCAAACRLRTAAAASSDAAAEYRQVHCSLAAFHNPCSDELEFLLVHLRQCGANNAAAAAASAAARNDGAPASGPGQLLAANSCLRLLLAASAAPASHARPTAASDAAASPASSWAAAAAAAAPSAARPASRVALATAPASARLFVFAVAAPAGAGSWCRRCVARFRRRRCRRR